jgi:hypothetical protein
MENIENYLNVQGLSSIELTDVYGGGDGWKIAVGVGMMVAGAAVAYYSGGAAIGVAEALVIDGFGLVASNLD